MWAYNSPAEGFFGSASVSLCLWWVRWSRAYPKALPFMVIVWRMTSKIRSGRRALKLRCAHKRLQTRHSHAGEGANEVGKSDRVRVDGLPGSPDVQQPQRTKQVQSSK
ncbi:hypothetical protein TYRP_014823, partial [Tyrophagus putrescentiae]